MNWIISYRWWIILSSLIFTFLIASGMQDLAFNPDSRVFFSEENPQLIALENLEDTFNKNENVYLAIRPKQGDIFNSTTLKIIRELTAESWKTPYSSRVNSITNYQHMSVAGDNLFVANLVADTDLLSEIEISEIKHIALNEHALVHHLVNPKGTKNSQDLI
ncbi:MAG: hypothetical protein KAG34_03305 [Cocleimonas sp.]|nr:hypothetical protein [Cocleimonas sp.]